MLNLDSIKLSISNEYLRYFNPDLFTTNTKSENNSDEKTVSYQLKLPERILGLKQISIYETQGFLTVELSAKLLRENYFQLINKNTVENLFFNLNSLNVIKLNPNCINVTDVFKCDVTNNMILKDKKEIKRYLQSLSVYKLNNKYECKLYDSESIVFNKRVKTNSLKEYQTFYYKYPEIQRDKELLKYVNRNDCLEMLRCESKFTSFKQMRKAFKIQDLTLMNILNSNENVNLNIFNRITKDIDSNKFSLIEMFKNIMDMKRNLKPSVLEKKLGMLNVLSSVNYDIDLIKVYLATNSTANNSRKFKEYKSLLKSYNDCKSDTSIQEDIEQIRNYLNVA